MAKKTEEEKKEEPKPEEGAGRGSLFKDQTEAEFCEWINNQAANHPVVKKHHGKWKELIAWEQGNQFTYWDTSSRTVAPANLSKRKRTVVINFMKPLNETIEGKINFYHKTVGVPNSEETKDIFGSIVATKLIGYNDYVNDKEVLMEEAKEDLLRPGISCIKWYWDPNAYGWTKNSSGERIREPGEVIGEVVPIFNIRPDPTAKTKKKMRWLIELKRVTRQEILDNFKDITDAELDEIADQEGTANKYVGMYEIEEEQDPNEETFVVKIFTQRPSKLYPKGRIIYTVGPKVIYANINKNPEHDINYFFFFYKKNKYSFWPMGPLHFVQDIQRGLNRMISIVMEHIEAWRPKIAVGKGALKRAQSFTMDAFEILEVDSSRGDPRPVPMPELSPRVTEMRDFLLLAKDLVSNVHEVSYSRLPQYASRAPASLYSMMLEQENIKLDPMVKKINSVLVEMDTFRLKLMAQHYKLPRLVKIIGKNRESMIEYFSGESLNQNFDVRLEVGVSLNQSPTIQTRLLMELWDKGILKGKDGSRILRLLNFGTGEREIRSDLADSERIMREEQAFMDGTYGKPRKEGGVFVYRHDDHELHMDSHTNLLKSAEAQKWEDATWKALEAHVEEHWVLFIAEKQMFAAGGAPAPPPAEAGGIPGAVGRGPLAEGGEPMIEGALGAETP